MTQRLNPIMGTGPFLEYIQFASNSKKKGPHEKEGRLLAYVLVRDRDPIWSR